MPQPSQLVESEVRESSGVPEDFLPIHGTDHVEFYTGNAKQAAHGGEDVKRNGRSGLDRDSAFR